LKILFVHTNADLYGASRSLLRLVTVLDRNVFEPLVILPESGPLLDVLESNGVAVNVVPYLSVIQRRTLRTWRLLTFGASLVPSIIKLWMIIRQESIDVVHTNTATTPTTGVSARLAGIPHIWHLREMFADDFPQLWRYFASFMLHFANKILCVSTPIMGQFRSDPKVEVLYNGLDISEFNLDNSSIKAWREKLGVSDRTRLVGVASRISPWKGQDIFLQACALLKIKAKNVHYVVIGDAFKGNEHLIHRLKEYVRTNNLDEDVTFTGFLYDPKSLIAALDVLVLPSSRPDPFPGIVLEGMALEVPIVATNIGGSAEQVEHGVTGLLVPPRDAESMANAILEILKDADLQQSMGKAGRERVIKEFSLNRVCGRLEDLYGRLIG